MKTQPPTPPQSLDLAFAALQTSPSSSSEDLFYKEAYKFVKRNLPNIPNGISIEDVVQTCIIHLWENLQKFNGKSKFSTWATTVVWNKAMDYLEGEAKRLKGEVSYDMLPDTPSMALTPGRELIVEESLRVLPPKEAVIVDLTRKGHNNREIGGILDMHSTTVSKLWNSALERLEDK
jgi:RNA polymerase sigma factor (sigma-70 family)